MLKNSIFKNAQDFRKSLELRLQKAAKEKGIDLQRIRRQVAFDRLLARFFCSARNRNRTGDLRITQQLT
jgi:hypothetical protein